MKKRKIIAAIFLCVSVLANLTVYAAGSVPKPVLEATESVVRITAEYKDYINSGTGFVIYNDSKNTYIATNCHVIGVKPSAISVWVGANQPVSASIFASDEQKDLCILRLAYPVALRALYVDDSPVRQGDAVYAVGFPSAADALSESNASMVSEATITDGIVSALRKTTVKDHDTLIELLQINAAINPGNSGGPLFSVKGTVIGINTYSTYDSQGIFGAISAKELLALMTDYGIVRQGASAGALWWAWAAGGAILIGCAAAGTLFLKKKKSRRKTAGKKSPSGTLRTVLTQREVPYTPSEAVSILMPAALKLRDLHNSGKTHLEISPDTVYIRGNTSVLSVPSGEETRRYISGFAAPEIYSGSNAGSEADIYSFCALLQYMTTGILPENALSRHRQHAGEAADPAAAQAEIPEGSPAPDEAFAAILAQGMRLDKDDRFASVQELIFKLAPYNTGVTPPKPKSKPLQQSRPAHSEPESNESTSNEPTSNEPARDKPVHKKPVKKAPRKKTAAIICLSCAAALLLGAAGAYAVCYTRAVSLADGGHFAEADKYLWIKPVTRLHDAQLEAYIDAGITLQDGQYDDAEAAFTSLEQYRNSEAFSYEALYRKAAQLADMNKFSEAITLFESLASIDYKDSETLILDTKYHFGLYLLYERNAYRKAYGVFTSLLYTDGYEAAREMCSETQYLWACDLIEKENYVEAYKRLKTIPNYDKAKETFATLTESMYQQGQQAYHNNDLDSAKEIFELISEYQHREDYLTLIYARTATDFNYLGKYQSIDELMPKLLNLFNFEDTPEVLVARQAVACEFLAGTWRSNDGYYFIMDKSYSNWYNLPGFDGDTYTIHDGIYYISSGNTDTQQFKFTVISPDIVQIYCYADGTTHTLYRE